MPVEAEVRFLNIDLVLVGRFDRKALVAAMGDAVFALHDDATTIGGEPCLILEVLEPDLDLAGTLTRLADWARALPPAARRAWSAAPRRVFDIGIQTGQAPHESHWTLSAEQIALLAKLNAEVVVTVYGAKSEMRAPVVQRGAPRPKKRTPRPRRGRRTPVGGRRS